MPQACILLGVMSVEADKAGDGPHVGKRAYNVSQGSSVPVDAVHAVNALLMPLNVFLVHISSQFQSKSVELKFGIVLSRHASCLSMLPVLPTHTGLPSLMIILRCVDEATMSC